MAKKNFYYFLCLLALFLIAAAAFKVFSARPYLVPQLVLLFVVSLAMREDFVRTLWFSFLAGFLLELFSVSFFGANIIGLIGAALAALIITRNLTSGRTNLLTVSFLVVLGTALFPLLAYLYLRGGAWLNLAGPVSFGDLVSARLAVTALSNVIFFYPVNYARSLLSKKYD